MKTEDKAKKVQNIATALAAIFGAVGAFFGIFFLEFSKRRCRPILKTK